MNTSINFSEFISAVKEKTSDRIIALFLIGSATGIEDPTSSDIDLIAVVKDGTNKNEIYKEVRALEEQYLTIRHSKHTNYIQRYLYGSDDFTGIHLMMMYEKQAKSKDLHINPLINLFMSQALFLEHIRREGKLLFGENKDIFKQNISIGVKERILSFLPIIPLIFLPILPCTRKSKIIWISKFAKYHYQLARDYYRILFSNPSYSFDQMRISPQALSLITNIRYSPDKFLGNTFLLSMTAAVSILKNWRFIFEKNALAN